jgi:hypothetical protein
MYYWQLRDDVLAIPGAQWFRGEWNINLIGIRRPREHADQWADGIALAFEQRQRPVVLEFEATTTPGKHYLHRPITERGTAILAPGHYPRAFKLGQHKGQYRALVQSEKMAVYRDDNRDSALDRDPDSIERGMFGINLHRAGIDGTVGAIGKWSAGCQVIRDPHDWNLFMTVILRSARKYGPFFSYTLLEVPAP